MPVHDLQHRYRLIQLASRDDLWLDERLHACTGTECNMHAHTGVRWAGKGRHFCSRRRIFLLCRRLTTAWGRPRPAQKSAECSYRRCRYGRSYCTVQYCTSIAVILVRVQSISVRHELGRRIVRNCYKLRGFFALLLHNPIEKQDPATAEDLDPVNREGCFSSTMGARAVVCYPERWPGLQHHR